MAKKKTGLSQTLFRNIDPYAQSSEAGGEELISLPITAVFPDPGQPRRLLPPDLGQAVASSQLSSTEAMRQWTTRPASANDLKLRELRKLAASIEKHGLINPITVRTPHPDEQPPMGVTHFIVTGERRYWSHILLFVEGRHIQTGAETTEPDHIRALQTASGITIRAHQLIENLMREDINAIEKAQGLWALRYELSGVIYRSPADGEVIYRSPHTEDEPEDGEGEPSLVPWTAVCEALGISKRYRILLTDVLKLSPEAQEIVTTYNLAEMTIRPIVQKLKGRSDLQQLALHQLVVWQTADPTNEDTPQAITKAVQELVERLLRQDTKTASPGSVVLPTTFHSEIGRFREKIRDTARFLYRLPDRNLSLLAQDLATRPDYADTVQELAALRQQIDDLLSRIEGHKG